MTQFNTSFLNKTRKDKFILVISAPKIMREEATLSGLNDIQISVFGSPVPDIVVPAETIDWKGQQLKVTSQSREPYSELSVDFTVDSDFKNYFFLWKWLDHLNKVEDSGMDSYFNQYKDFDNTETIARTLAENRDTISTVAFNEIVNKKNNDSVYHDYQVDLTLFGIDEYNKKKIEFTYTKAFPTELGQINYNYRDSDEAECSVSFAFSQFHAKLVDEC